MSRVMDDMWAQFQQLSGALKFGIIGLAFIIAFLVWHATLGSLREQWVGETLKLEQKISEARAAERLQDEFLNLSSAIKTTGPVEPPASAQEASNALTRTVTGVLEQYGVQLRADTFNTSSGGSLPTDALGGAIDERIDLVTGTLEFEASPEIATTIVRELETSPDIESINELRLTRLGSGQVKVRIELEAWALRPPVRPNQSTI